MKSKHRRMLLKSPTRLAEEVRFWTSSLIYVPGHVEGWMRLVSVLQTLPGNSTGRWFTDEGRVRKGSRGANPRSSISSESEIRMSKPKQLGIVTEGEAAFTPTKPSPGGMLTVRTCSGYTKAQAPEEGSTTCLFCCSFDSCDDHDDCIRRS